MLQVESKVNILNCSANRYENTRGNPAVLGVGRTERLINAFAKGEIICSEGGHLRYDNKYSARK